MADAANKQLEVKKNGVRSYDAEVDAHPPSKEDVEARLRSTSESISMRLDAIQDEIGSTGESVRRLLADNPMAAVIAAVAAGFAVGALIGGRSDDEPVVPRSVISGLAAAIDDAMMDGLPSDEAAYQAVDEFQDYLKPASGAPAKAGIGKVLLRAGLTMLVRHGIKNFTDSSDA